MSLCASIITVIIKNIRKYNSFADININKKHIDIKEFFFNNSSLYSRVSFAVRSFFYRIILDFNYKMICKPFEYGIFQLCLEYSDIVISISVFIKPFENIR